MIEREHYIEPIRPFYDSDLIKIITGIRRCGKSVILNQIKEEIRKKTDNIIFLDFEDAAISSAIPNCASLLDYVDTHRKKGKCYLFFDEIQSRRVEQRIDRARVEPCEAPAHKADCSL